MRKHRILAGILAVALVLSLGGVNISAATGSPMTNAAEVPVPEGYCELDYLKLYAFLEMADADGVKNGTKLNENYDPTDPTTWGTTNEEGESTITWLEVTTGEGVGVTSGALSRVQAVSGRARASPMPSRVHVRFICVPPVPSNGFRSDGFTQHLVYVIPR